MSLSVHGNTRPGETGNSAAEAQVGRDEILGAFEGQIKPVKTSILYQAGLLFVAAAMIIVPIVYLSIIAAVAYGGYLHAVNDVGVLREVRNARGALLVYLGPLFACGVLLLFLIKPIFARPVHVTNAVVLQEEDEPLLFAFVRKLCQAVHAPVPKIIRIDCDVNASASFRDGLGGYLAGDLVLTIGMPLIAGLNLRQLAGVLAHELGHFSQRGGMRLTYLSISISHWLERVVYERDKWDAQLEDAAQESDGWMWFVVQITRLLVWITRRVLWLLTMASRLFTFYMRRQMEFNADMHEIRLAGSTAFESTTLQMSYLGAAFNATLNEVADLWQERRLSDDFPDAVASTIEGMPKEVRHAIMQGVSEDKSAFFSTHPSDAARISKARREGARGVFRLEAPARSLLRNYSSLALDCSTIVYHAMLGPEFTQAALVSSKDVAERRKSVANDMEAVALLCGQLWRTTCPIISADGAVQPPAETLDLVRELEVVHKGINAGLASADEAVRRLDGASRRIDNCCAALALLDAGFSLPADPFGLPSRTRDGIERFATDARERLNTASREMEKMGALLHRRAAMASLLLKDPEIRQKAEVAPDEMEKMLHTVRILKSGVDDVNRLRASLIKVHVLMEELDAKHSDEEKARLVSALLSLARGCNNISQELRGTFRQQAYPLAHGKPGMTIADYLANQHDSPTEEQMLQHAAQTIDCFDTLYARAAGQLGRMTAAIEKAVGLASPQLASSPAAS